MNFVDRMFKMSSLSFQAYDGCVLHCQQMKQQDVLFTIGNEKSGMNILKACSLASSFVACFLYVTQIWHLDKFDKYNMPLMVRNERLKFAEKATVRLQSSLLLTIIYLPCVVFRSVLCMCVCAQVTAFAVFDDMTQCAFGLDNGAVYVITGDLSRGKISKPQQIRGESREPVTGKLAFCG